MVSIQTLVITIVGSIFASTGFWAFLSNLTERKSIKDNAQAQMLKGLGHDRICWLGQAYVKRGSITKDEYENLVEYLYVPYKALGGNGTAEKVIREVEKLPLTKEVLDNE